MKVDPNLNVILTACLTVYVGCYRSVKATPPSVSEMAFLGLRCFYLFLCHHAGVYLAVLFTILQETMSNEHAMRFPLVGSAVLLSLFLLFKFLSKDLVNAVLTCYFFVLGIVALSYVLSIWIILLYFFYILLLRFCLIAHFHSFYHLLFVEQHYYLR